MSNELLNRYREAEIQHKEKFGKIPIFVGMFMPGLDGEEYIAEINKALRTGVPVNQRKTAPKEFLDDNIIW